MQPCYLEPLVIISRNKGGTYSVSELDGSVFDWPIAAFQVIPYFARQKLNIPPLEELINIAQKNRRIHHADPEEDNEAWGKDFENY